MGKKRKKPKKRKVLDLEYKSKLLLSKLADLENVTLGEFVATHPDLIDMIVAGHGEDLLDLVMMASGKSGEEDAEWAKGFMKETEHLPTKEKGEALREAVSFRRDVITGRDKLKQWAEVYGEKAPLDKIMYRESMRKPGVVTSEVPVLRPLGLTTGNVVPDVHHLPKDVLPESVVDSYLEFVQSARTISFRKSKAGDDDAASKFSMIWSELRDASIFCLPVELFLQFYRQLDQYAIQGAGGWEADLVNGVWEGSPGHKTINWLGEKASGQFLPEKRPFSNMFLAYEVPLSLSGYHFSLFSYAQKEGFDHILLLGHLITETSVYAAVKMVGGTFETSGFASLEFIEEYREGSSQGWVTPWLGTPWVVPCVIDWINEHKTVLEDSRSFSYKRKIEKGAKEMKLKKFLPPPYYTVYLKDELIKNLREYAASVIKKTIEWSHRWTVRGHWVARVKRGPLPLLAEDAEVLEKRKYKIFTFDDPDFDTWSVLQKRGVKPKKKDEWMAVLIVWRKDYIKGPDGKPLIPSIRKSARERGELQ